MTSVFIANRTSLEDAARLIEQHGDAASLKAASLAEASRRRDNVRAFCHWRQIERVVDMLACSGDEATRH